MSSIKLLLTILVTMFIAACGGGGGSSTTSPTSTAALTGVFNDALVSGLNYYTSTGFGGCTSLAPCSTNSAGQFNYAAGNSVTFIAAGVTLGTATNLPTTTSVNSPAVVTPVSLAPSGSTASSGPVVAIGQFLSGLNSVALQSGQGGNGVFTIPTATGTNSATVSTLLNSLQNSGVTNLSAITTGLPVALQTALTAASGTIPSAPQVTANITQSVNSTSVLGSVWTGTCTQCNAGAGSNVNLMLNPDGVVRGFVKINSSSSGEGSVIGGWEGYTTIGACSAATSGVASTTSACFTARPAPNTDSSAPWTSFDTSYILGTVSTSAGTGTVLVYDSTNLASPYTVSLTEQMPSSLVSTTYLGGWLLTLGPATVANIAQGQVSGSTGFIIIEPNGSFVTNSSSANVTSSTFNFSTGIGSGTSTNTNNSPTNTCGTFASSTETTAINLANGTATSTYVSGTLVGVTPGTVMGTSTFTRVATSAAEILTSWADNGGTIAEDATERQITMALNAQINWPANPPPSGNSTHGINIDVALTGDPSQLSPGVASSCGLGYLTPGSLTKLEANAIKPELSPVGFGGSAGTSSDTISFGYIQGQAQHYNVTVQGSTFCSVTSGGSGAVNDANANNASAYPTVVITCTQ